MPALRQHLEEADIYHLKPVTNSDRARDAFRYRITVTEGDVTHTATASDADMPDALSPLIAWLSERASNTK